MAGARSFVVLLLCSLLQGCGEKDRREPGDHNGREEPIETPALPDGSSVDAVDVAEMADPMARFKGEGVELVYGMPGVMLTVEEESGEVALRDLSDGGHSASFSSKSRSISRDGEIIGHDAVLLSEENGTQWWRAVTERNTKIYFVINNY